MLNVESHQYGVATITLTEKLRLTEKTPPETMLNKYIMINRFSLRGNTAYPSYRDLYRKNTLWYTAAQNEENIYFVLYSRKSFYLHNLVFPSTLTHRTAATLCIKPRSTVVQNSFCINSPEISYTK